MRSLIYLFIISVATTASGVSHAQGPVQAIITPVNITLPTETLLLHPSESSGFALASAACYTCHSAEYIKTQPKLSQTTWKAEVLKMKRIFGAPIEDKNIDPIVEYLTKTYSQ